MDKGYAFEIGSEGSNQELGTIKVPLLLRTEVAVFALGMEARLKEKDEKYCGNSWKGTPCFENVHDCWTKKTAKIKHILDMYEKGGCINKDGLKVLLTDLANYCMMLPDTITGEKI